MIDLQVILRHRKYDYNFNNTYNIRILRLRDFIEIHHYVTSIKYNKKNYSFTLLPRRVVNANISTICKHFYKHPFHPPLVQ